MQAYLATICRDAGAEVSARSEAVNISWGVARLVNEAAPLR